MPSCSTTTSSRSVRSSPEVRDMVASRFEVPYLPRAGDHRSAATQRQLLCRALPGAVPPTGHQGDRAVRDARPPTIASWWPCRVARTAWRCGTCCSTSGTRPTACTSDWASATTATSSARVRACASPQQRGLRLIEISLRGDYGYDIPTAARATRRVPCSACGLSKRHLFDKAALDGGYTALGHGPQPRRRGGGAVRQHDALGDRVPGPPAAGARGP